ncbi:hypothetical protein, partial [Hydrogenimonas sp.]
TKERATVVTDEEWVYRYFRHIDVNKTAEAFAPAKMLYRVRYSLVKSHGVWKIAKIDILSETEKSL